VTRPADSPPQAFADLDDAIRGLRGSGLRLSTARRLVLDALFAADGPVSAAHLSRMLSLDESSVYRNLELLEQRGVVRHLHLGHSPGLYVLTSEHEVEYLYCERCAKVTAVTPDRLDPVRERVRQEFGYTPRFTHFAIVGICQDCADAPAAPAPQQEHLHSHGGYVHSHPGRAHHRH
jgi:Fur family ferric uptake transcriptional regulator